MDEEQAVDTGAVQPTESAPVESAPVEQPAPQVEQPAPQDEPTSNANDEKYVPYDRFKEVNDQLREMREVMQQQYQPQPQQQYAPQQPQIPSYIDPQTGEIDPIAYQSAIAQQAQQAAQRAAQETIAADRAWQEAESAHQDVKDPEYRALVESYMLSKYTMTKGKTQLSPKQAADELAKRFNQAKQEGVQAATVQETIRDAAALTPTSATIDEGAKDAASSERDFQARLNSRDKNIRQRAILEQISKRRPDVEGAIG